MTSSTVPGQPRIGARLLLPLAVLAAIAPFATDLYLPAFPSMVEGLETSESVVQLSLTAFLIGAALGQIVFGPLSDRFGRTRPLFVGLTTSVVASVVAALAPTIEVLVGARLVQGVSAAAGMVIGRAIVADIAAGAEAARALTMMMVVGGVAPVLAPVVGAALADPIGWRGLLWIVAALCLVALVLGVAFVRETHPAARGAQDRASAARAERRGLHHLASRGYVGNTLAFAFAFATMMAYISASPFLYQDLIGLTSIGYGLAFAANALVLMLVSWVSARLTARHDPARLAGIGLAVVAVSVVAITALALSSAPPAWIMVPLLTGVGAMGLVFGNTTALALSTVRESSGTGSAVLGFIQFLLAGLVAPLVSVGGEGSAVPMALTMLAATIIACTAFALARAARDRGRPSERAS